MTILGWLWQVRGRAGPQLDSAAPLAGPAMDLHLLRQARPAPEPQEHGAETLRGAHQGDKPDNHHHRNCHLHFFFEQESDWMWFRGDRVELLTGPDKGKQGYINYIVQVR